MHFRATFILLPLLGLHYVVMPFRPEPGAPGEIAYQIVSAVITSFQVPIRIHFIYKYIRPVGYPIMQLSISNEWFTLFLNALTVFTEIGY